MGRHFLRLTGGHFLWDHCLHELASKKNSPDQSHGQHPLDLSTDAVLAANPDTDLLGGLFSMGANVEPLRVCKTIYLPTPFFGIFLEWDLIPMESWNCLCSAIVGRGLEVDCCPIIGSLSFTLNLNTGNDKSPLAMTRPSAHLVNVYLLHHRHHMLTHHLPGMDPTPQRVHGYLIATHIGEVAVEMRRDRKAEALAHKVDVEKGIPELLGYNFTYLLRLGQVAALKDTPAWKEPTRAPKHQHMMTLQKDLGNISHCLSVCTPIIATPGLPKLTLALGFCLDHRDDLYTGTHQFELGQQTSASQKLLKDRIYQHQVIADGGTAPSLADMAMLTMPYGVSLLATLAIAQGDHAHLRVVVVTLFGPDPPPQWQ